MYVHIYIYTKRLPALIKVKPTTNPNQRHNNYKQLTRRIQTTSTTNQMTQTTNTTNAANANNSCNRYN